VPHDESPVIEVLKPSAWVSAATWPHIEGIDAADANNRLRGDIRLLRTMLGRLLSEFRDIGIDAASAGTPTLADHARRLHKLRGGAGLLGAKAIAGLAGAAEAACLEGRGADAVAIAADLASRLERLRESAAPVLEDTALGADAIVPPGVIEMDQHVAIDLIKRLQQKDLAAVDQFSAASLQFRQWLGIPTYRAVRDHIDNLRFKEAAELLEACMHPGER
jgi:HPt (histidine-containing phosphotransfer) domain-containing protein